MTKEEIIRKIEDLRTAILYVDANDRERITREIKRLWNLYAKTND